MKKQYNKPEIKIELLNEKDIILTSTTAGIGGAETNDFTFDIDEILKF